MQVHLDRVGHVAPLVRRHVLRLRPAGGTTSPRLRGWDPMVGPCRHVLEVVHKPNDIWRFSFVVLWRFFCFRHYSSCQSSVTCYLWRSWKFCHRKRLFCDEICKRHDWIVIDEHISSSVLSPTFLTNGTRRNGTMISTWLPGLLAYSMATWHLFLFFYMLFSSTSQHLLVWCNCGAYMDTLCSSSFQHR